MNTIVRWILNWLSQNASVTLSTSHVPIGYRLGGFNIPQATDVYLILTVLIKHRPVWTGYFQAV